MIYYIDLFSGAGGTTTGAHLAGAKVVACVNHDAKAIESHAANHPETIHFTEDIRDFAVVLKLKAIVDKLRIQDPGCILVIWASLECTNYSKAKGGLPRDADSRTLAEHLFMYLEQLHPEYLFIENVREFMSWGPLDESGKPMSRMAGIDYIKWVQKIQSYGFSYDWRLLNSANYGSYQSRERYFGQFAASGMAINWPEPTHSKKPKTKGFFGEELKKWKAVKDILDLNDIGQSIFNRKKPLVEATLKRIYAGLLKFVSTEQDSFIMRYNGGNPEEKVKTINQPIGAISTTNRHAVINAFIQKNYSGDPDSKVQDLTRPAGAITCKDHHSLVMLTSYYGTSTPISPDSPCHTVTTRDRFSAVFIDNQYGKGLPSSLNSPSPTVTIHPKQVLVSAQFLFNPQYSSPGATLEKPCFTLIARMDKRPPYLISATEGQISFNSEDSETMILIKKFMIQNHISDIRMRMLKIAELLKIQGFPESYILKGSQEDQKKFIGNAVDVNMSRAIVAANCEAIKSIRKIS